MTWNEPTRTLFVWTLQSGVGIYTLNERPEFVGEFPMLIQRNFPIQICMLGNERVACGSDNGEVLIWSVADRQVLSTLKHDPQGVLFLNSGVRIIHVAAYVEATLVQSLAVGNTVTRYSWF
jgi:hypothetical protein